MHLLSQIYFFLWIIKVNVLAKIVASFRVLHRIPSSVCMHVEQKSLSIRVLHLKACSEYT